MRYKVLVIDDELYILNWIAEMLLLQNRYEIDVFRADSAKLALQILDQHRVDIIVSDIKMPRMDGMELLDIVLDQWPHCKFIFLTAYGEFEYIYGAMQKGVLDFVLKTEDDDRILNAVYKAVNIIEKERKSEDLLCEADRKLETAQPAMQNMILKNMLYDSNYDIKRLQSDFDTAGIELCPKNPFFVLITRVEQNNSWTILDKMTNMMYLDSILCNRLHKKYHAISFISEDGNKAHEEYYFCSLIQPIQPKDNSETWLYHYLSQMLEDIHHTIMSVLDCSVSCCLSAEMILFEDLKTKYRLLRTILDIHKEKSAVILTEIQPEVAPVDEIMENYEISSDLDQLKQAILSGNSAKSLQLVEQFISIAHISRQQIYSYYSNVRILLIILRNKYQIPLESPKQVTFEEFCKSRDCMAELKNRIQMACQEIKQINEATEKNIVSCVKKYINDNLSGDLSLDTMSDQLYYNPSYLSRLFHQLTGVTISQYITHIRIEKAKIMLENQEMKIKDICKELGFDSSSYFSRFFKKETGYTPQKYRDKKYV